MPPVSRRTAVMGATQRAHRAVIHRPAVPRPPTPALLALATAEAGSVAPLDLTTLQSLVGQLGFTGRFEIEVIRPDDNAEGASQRASVPSDHERATSDDYTIVLVPVQLALGVFSVLAICANPATGAIWGIAAFLITIVLMRDEDFSKLVARAARYLRGE